MRKGSSLAGSTSWGKLATLTILVCILNATPLAGDDATRWSFGLDLRYRLEHQNHFNARYYGRNPPEGSGRDTLLLQRIRAGLRYRIADRVVLALGLQDSRASASPSRTSPSSARD